MSRFCPACGEPLEHRTARAVWCSGACRQRVHAIGGPASLAAKKRIDARIFRAMNGRSSPDAAELDRCASALESLEESGR